MEHLVGQVQSGSGSVLINTEVGVNHQQHGPLIPNVIQLAMMAQVVVVLEDVLLVIGYQEIMIHATMLCKE